MEVRSPTRVSDRPGDEARPDVELDVFTNPKSRPFFDCVLAIEQWIFHAMSWV
ncbi:hypothetical protein PISMIDRAFT_678061 [Pisolithus microcarpus 441]|uniref:Uncharacterized protein n=1 Tax=Pisolithus microcarpus 441 TaxID=765257 RepID=A0A0C9YI13_9AGAM|nr:hypothetical protein PISMIDRAFT_678061 [Pisolithus microcarpus 441]